MFNIELANRAIKAIEADLEHWNQGDWRMETECGTKYCFAGFVAMLSGASWAEPSQYAYKYDWVHTPDDRYMQVADYAMEQLGLDVNQSWGLFYCGGDLDELKFAISALEKKMNRE